MTLVQLLLIFGISGRLRKTSYNTAFLNAGIAIMGASSGNFGTLRAQLQHHQCLLGPAAEDSGKRLHGQQEILPGRQPQDLPSVARPPAGSR